MIPRWRAWTWYASYRGQTGQWAQLLHRVTGLGVVLFLLLHIVDTWLIGWGPEPYDTLVAIYHLPPVRVIQVLLGGAVLFHAINGIRVTVIDFWPKASLHQERLFWGAMAIFLLLFLPAAYVMVAPIFQ